MQAPLLIFDRENKKSILHINWSNLKVLPIFPLCLSQATFSVLINIKLKGLITNVFFMQNSVLVARFTSLFAFLT